MKYFAIISVLILIATLVGVSSLYLTDKVVVEATGAIAMEASANETLFDELAEQVRLNAVVGTSYVRDTTLGDASQYQFITYTVRLRNDTSVDAELCELQITPMNGDILQLGATDNVIVPAGQTVDVTATILTAVNMHPIREIIVSYYMWGAPFSLTTTVQ